MPITDDLGRYLGMPSIHGRVTKQSFQQISDRVDKNLAGWKSNILSMAVKATFIQSTISAISNFAMQTAKIPRSICNEVDRKTKCFVWGGNDNSRKVHNVSWDIITKSKMLGGLGFKPMRDTNASFLTKLWWRLLAITDKLWSKVLRAKYCDNITPKCSCKNKMFQIYGMEYLITPCLLKRELEWKSEIEGVLHFGTTPGELTRPSPN